LSQGYHDLRITVVKGSKSQKEYKLTVSGIQVLEAPRKMLEALSLENPEKIVGTSNLYSLSIQFGPKSS
jgi:hypothetical protein